MTKSKIALAVAGVLSAPVAMAQTSTVTLYGRANLGLDHYQATGAQGGSALDLKGRLRVFDFGSRLGVRGVEDLGGGLRAVFQIESGLNADTGNRLGQGAQTNVSTGFLGSRPSWVGLDGAFGRVLWGRQDVWWGNGTIAQSAATYINQEVPFLTGGNGRVSVGVARQTNVFSYTTPTFGGFNASLYWSPDTNTAGGESVPANGFTANTGTSSVVWSNNETAQFNKNTNARLIALTARWAGGPISLQFDGVQRQTASDQFVGARPKAQGLKLGIGFTYAPGAQISLVASNTKLTDFSGTAVVGGASLKQNAAIVNWEHVFGRFQALAQFGMTQKVKGCDDGVAAIANATVCDNSAARGWMLGGRWLASKRTALYLTYNQVRNDANSYSDYTGGASTSGPLGFATRGADPRIIAVGVIHNF